MEIAGAAGALVVQQISATGTVLSTVTQPLAVLDDGMFHTVTRTVAIADGVSKVRVQLSGGLVETTTFDDVRLWEE